MAILALAGYSGSGKDEVGTIIQYLTSEAYKEGRSYEKYLERSTNPVAFGMIYNHTWEIKKWAGKLKQIASILTNIPINKFEDQEFKKTKLGSEWNYDVCGRGGCIKVEMTVREFLQKLGTDSMRNGLHHNTWVNALMSEYTPIAENWDSDGNTTVESYPNWIITDTRFPNEAQAIKDNGGKVIRVYRKGVKPINDHPSEVGLDNWDFDAAIYNNGSIDELIESVKVIMNIK